MRVLAPVAFAFVAIVLMALGAMRLDGAGVWSRDREGPVPEARHASQDGHVMAGPYRVLLEEIRTAVDRFDRKRRGRFHTWDVFDRRPATASALGAGGDAHFFVNSFLVGFQPFAVESPTIPRAVIARRKTYTRDHVQYSGRADVWQNSRQAWIAPRGDCEDHALLLADWLIEYGLDARVVLGKARGEGHAWVVVLDEGRQYLLEATDKRSRRRALPRAELVRGYHPWFQFDREHFWVNTGHPDTRDYAGDHWERRSRFVREAGRAS